MLHDRKTRLVRERRLQAQQLSAATTIEEREQIQRIIDGLDDQIEYLEEELVAEMCYVLPTPTGHVVTSVGVELSQSTQHFHDGSGAGAPNSIPLVEGKPTLIRVYVRYAPYEPATITGRLSVMALRPGTFQYDIPRASLGPLRTVATPGSTPSAPWTSRRSQLFETLNFILPAEHCHGQLRYEADLWVVGHESDPFYHGSGVAQVGAFTRTRTPIVHLFRINIAERVAVSPTPVTVNQPAPTLGDCQLTMALAERMFPTADLDIRDRGTRRFPQTGSAPLVTPGDFDAVRRDIQTFRDLTSPTPADNELFVAMLPGRPGRVFGTQLDQSLQSTARRPGMVEREDLFAHELGHWLLPGHDHVEDPACIISDLPLDQIDGSYPDYPNATQRAGTGEWGVDFGPPTPALRGPEWADIMSYCGNQWISPYNYVRALNGSVLSWPVERGEASGDSEKLVVAIRVHRDNRVERRWAIHVPGEPPPSGTGATDLVVELHDSDGAPLASTTCRRPADRPGTGPYEDFQVVLPWFEDTAHVVVARGREELTRWPVEEAEGRPRPKLGVKETSRGDGASTVQVSWDEPEDAGPVHYVLRFTPDDGETWIPVAHGIEGGRVDVDPDVLRGIDAARFQLAVSTGFRTTLVESDESVRGRPLEPELTIIEPTADALYEHGDPIWLVGAATTLDRAAARDAYWCSNRDGFLGDGLRVVATGLSVGRHVLRLVSEDGSGGELTQAVAIRVVEPGDDRHGEARG